MVTIKQLRMEAIQEELDEIEEGIPELTGIWNHLFNEHLELATACYPMLKEKLDMLRMERNREVPAQPAPPAVVSQADLLKAVEELQSKLAAMSGQPSKPPVAPLPRADKKYRLLDTDVSRWTGKPQVHAVMDILAAHVKVGEVFTNSQAVEAMRLNREALGTRQDPADVWDYYKGRSADGLLQHGNIEVA
jgi:hypothetical protein